MSAQGVRGAPSETSFDTLDAIQREAEEMASDGLSSEVSVVTVYCPLRCQTDKTKANAVKLPILCDPRIRARAPMAPDRYRSLDATTKESRDLHKVLQHLAEYSVGYEYRG